MSLILYIDDNNALLVAFQPVAGSYGMELLHRDSVEAGLSYLEQYEQTVDAVILDLGFPEGQKQGLEGLKEIKTKHPDIPVVVLTVSDSATDISTAVKSIKLGAYDYIGKTKLDTTHLFHVLNNAILQSRLTAKVSYNGHHKRDKKIDYLIIEKEDKFYLYKGYEITELILESDKLNENYIINNEKREEHLQKVWDWNLKMLQIFAGRFNDVLRMRTRMQKDEGAKHIRTYLGFEVKSHNKNQAKQYLDLVLYEFDKLMKMMSNPYKYQALDEPELLDLWSFDDIQEHYLFSKKPVAKLILSKSNNIGFHHDLQNDKEIRIPGDSQLNINHLNYLYESMLTSDDKLSFTVTLNPEALKKDDLDLIGKIIKGRGIKFEDDIIISDKEGRELFLGLLRAYYKKIKKESKAGYFVSTVLSTGPSGLSNVLAQSVIRSFYNGHAEYKKAAIDEISKIDYSKSGIEERLKYHYTADAAVTVFHLPFMNHYDVFKFIRKSYTYYPKELKDSGVLLGVKQLIHNEEKKIYVDEPALKRHHYILGQTGTGKSTMIKTMALDLIKKGKGCCIIDPHGDLFDDMKQLIPENRKKDVVIFDTSDIENSAKLNVLDYDRSKPETKSRMIQELVKAFDYKYSIREQGGFMFELFLRAAIYLVLSDKSRRLIGEHPTMIDVKEVIDDYNLRDALIDLHNIDKSKYSRKSYNEILQSYKKKRLKSGSNNDDEYIIKALRRVDKMSGDGDWENFVPYINAKLAVFTDNKYINPLFNSTNPDLNLREIMDEGKILLVKLDKGQIGFGNLNIIGGVFLSKLILAILSRSELPANERKDFYVFIDEFHNFIHGDVASALAEVRKYNVSLILANQTLGQLDQSMIDAVLGNVGNISFFRPGINDYQKIKHYFTSDFSEEDVLKLPNFNCITTLLIENMPSSPFVFQTIKPEE